MAGGNLTDPADGLSETVGRQPKTVTGGQSYGKGEWDLNVLQLAVSDEKVKFLEVFNGTTWENIERESKIESKGKDAMGFLIENVTDPSDT